MRITALLGAIVLSLTTLAACGGDDTDEASGDSLGAIAEELVGCLSEAGLDASVSEATSLGVDDDHVGIDVDGMDPQAALIPSSDTPQGADLYVLADAESAERNFTAFSLSREQDEEKAWIDGAVVIRFHYRVVRTHPQVVSLEDCVASLG